MTGKTGAQKALHLDRDLKVCRTHVHWLSGARLILACTKDKKDGGEKKWIVAWAGHWQKTLKDYDTFDGKDSAGLIFAAKKEASPPKIPALMRDWQRGKVYEWETKTFYGGSPKLTPGQMKHVVRRISEDFNMVAPRIHYKKPHPGHKDPTSYYYGHLNKILMRHKELSLVFHEVAHAIDGKLSGNKWSDHGPSYVRTLIRLAERYQIWHDPEKLEQSAIEHGILIAPESAVRHLPAPRA